MVLAKGLMKGEHFKVLETKGVSGLLGSVWASADIFMCALVKGKYTCAK